MPRSRFETQIRAVLAGRPSDIAIDFDGSPFTWGEVRAVATAVEDIIDQTCLHETDRVGLIGRNLPAHFAALWGIFISGRCVSNIHAYQPPQALAEELSGNRWPLVLASPRDWSEDVIAAAEAAGTVGYALQNDASTPLKRVTRTNEPGKPFHRRSGQQIAIQLLSSGTTGKPKRIDLDRGAVDEMIERTIAHFEQAGPAAGETQIMPWPLSSLGGTNAALPAAVLGQRMAIQEKFNASGMLTMIRRYRPAFLSLPPSAIAMVLQLQPNREDFSSVKLFASGSAPLDSEVRQALLEAYGVPTAEFYGATEFAGIITQWPERDQDILREKAGSVGRALQGVQIRVVSENDGERLPDGETGLIEAFVPRVGEAWVRTNDLGHLDADGFLYIEGRADDTILRGGMKVFPQEVAEVLRTHDKIRDAAVIGIPDERLGFVPVAAIETRSGQTVPTAAELEIFLRARLSPHKIPVKFAMVDEIPRTQSMKPQRQAMRALFAGPDDCHVG